MRCPIHAVGETSILVLAEGNWDAILSGLITYKEDDGIMIDGTDMRVHAHGSNGFARRWGGWRTGAGVMFEAGDEAVKTLLVGSGWTTLTGICLMIFSLCQYPCSTTLHTIYKETRSFKWTVISALLPTVLGVVLCGIIARIWRALT